MQAVRFPGVLRFGVFEVDVRSGELRRNGMRVRLPEQSFQILAMLLTRAGEMVTREEIRQKLWPNNTIVEFDHSINAAIRRLREALNDSAEDPRFVETLARRGYRFKAAVERLAAGPSPVPAAETPDPHTGELPVASEPEPGSGDLRGRTISHYQILKKLGSGGMGVVYMAEDTTLGRKVALKFLPDEVAGHSQALERFQREARSASALNHPNICTIYEVSEDGGRPFISMELLEGQTLEQRIGGKPLKTAEALEIANQIADALEAAHSHGIIHRDIKPTNVMITTWGQAKVLDFGLAKFIREPAGVTVAPGVASQPSATADGGGQLRSRTGIAIGTAAYMSPEQARGEELDARTDLFSFGAVLYEMVTGRQAFSGDTPAVISGAILHVTPAPPLQLNPELPPKFEEIVNRAIEKDRDLRYQTASDIRAELKRLRRDTDSGRAAAGIRPAPATLQDSTRLVNLGQDRTAPVSPTQGGAIRPALLRRWPAVLAGAGGIAAAALALWLTRPLPPPKVSGYAQLTDDGRQKPSATSYALPLPTVTGGPPGKGMVQRRVSSEL